ncbi:MAG TPA: autotransporter-associated beta strand repeat-containing protein [Verrucomicrobiae bacterium]|nr:autotransporter-associated beta strand repeat-containing protein [Verrucomicrobiae bacterium]
MKKSKHQPQSVCHLNQFTQRWHRLLPVGLLMLAAWNGLAASGDWTNNAASVWSAATNWSSNPTVPGTTAGDSVGLTFDITANRTVTIDTTARTVGTLNIGDPTSGYFAYTLAASGGANLTFNNNGLGALLYKPTAANTALDLISTPLVLADNLTIDTSVTGTGNSGNSLQFTGLITESGGPRTLTKNGVGGMYLNVGSLNNYSGGTIVNAGEIQFSSSLALGTGTIVMNGGSLAARTAARTLTNSMIVGGDFTFNSANAGGNSLTLTGDVDLGNATRTITVASTANPSAFLSGIISGNNSSVGLIKAGPSVLNISGANTFSGDTRIAAGGLQLRVTPGAPAGTSLALQNSTLDLAPEDVGVLSFQGSAGTVAATLGGLKGSRNVALLNTSGASVALTVGNNGQSTTYSGILSGTGGSLTKIGAGTLILSGANTYDGITTISGGSLQLGDGGDSGSLFAIGYIQNDGNLTINRNNAVVQGVDFGGGTIAGAGSFTQAGSGTTTLNMANSYSGTTTVSAGKLVVDSQQSSAGAVSVADGATLGITVSSFAQWQPASLSLGAGAGCTLEFNNVANAGTGTAPLNPGSVSRNGTVTVNVVGISGAIVVGGSGYPLLGNMAGATTGYTLGTQPPGVSGHLAVLGTTLTFVVDSVSDIWNAASPGGDWDVLSTPNWTGNAANNSPANTFQNGDSVLFNDTVAGPQAVTIKAPVTPSQVNVDNAATEYSITSSGANNIGGTTGLAKSGSGTLTLSGPNTYGGGTTLSGGRLNINDGGTSSANSAIGTGPLTIDGGTLGNTGFGDVTLLPNNPQFWNGNFGYDGTGFNLDLGTGAVTPSASRQINVSANTLKIGGIIGGGAISLTKTGNGTLALSGANTFSGGLMLNGGQLDINGGSAIGSGTLTIGDATTIDNSSGSDVALLANNPQVWNGNFTYAGSANLNLGTGPVSLTGTRTVTVNGNTLTVGGVISGAFGLTKSGPGTLVLTGVNTYGNNGASDTAVNGGTLVLGNDQVLGSSRLNLADGVTIQSIDSSPRVITNSLNFGSGAGGNNFFAGTGNLKFTASANNGTSKTLTINNPVTEFSGVLSGAMTRTIAGTGILIFSGANTYSLGTIINPGATLQLGNGGGTGSLSTSGAITVDGMLRFNRTNALVQGTHFSAAPITGSGSVIQDGEGTTTLTAANTYTGPTIVNNGALFITPAYQAGADVIVANGTSFGVSANSVSNSATVGTLTLGSGGATTLDFSYGLTGNPTNAALFANSIIINGSSSIRIGGSFAVGTFPVLKYNSLSGAFSSTVTGPRGVTATLSNDVVNKVLYVIISSVGNGVVWTGTNSVSPNLWDLNTTVNWLIGGSPTTYFENVPPGDAVTFNDSGNGLVLLSNLVSPASVTFNNSAVSYTVEGTGGQINSAAGLTKTGAGSVTLNVPGNFSGNTVISNGPISIGANQTWANLSGNSAVNSSAGTPTLTVNNSLNTTFVGSFAGALGLAKTGVGEFTLPGSNNISGNLFVKAGGVTLDSGYLGLGTFASIGQNGTDDGTLTVKGTATIVANSDFNVGDVGASVGTLNLQDTASLTANSIFIGSANAASSTASGTVNQTGGTVTQLNTAAGSFCVGGRVENTSVGGVGIYNLSGGALNVGAGIRVGSAGPGTFNQSGGVLNANGDVNIGRFAASVGTYNLDGGTLRAARVLSSIGPNATLNLNGGVLVPIADNTLFVTNLAQVNIRNGGAVIDTAGFNVNIAATLQHSFIGGDNPIDGGLTKRGEGTLSLSDAFSSYTGPTFVAGGVLRVSPSSALSLNDLTVSNATLRLAVNNGGASVNAATLKLAGTAALNVNYDQLFGAPVTALNVSGGITVSGTTTINVYGYGLTVGQFTLVDYTGTPLADLSNFALDALPYGVTASLVNNTANTSIDLLVTAVSPLNWIPLIASDTLGSSSFNSGLNWQDFSPPSAGNGYSTRAFTVRSPANNLAHTFGGDILAIDEGGQLLLKGTGGQVITVNNLLFNGGLIVYGVSTGDNLTETLAGNITLQSGTTSSLGVNGSANASETLTITAPISGGGNLRVGVGAGNVGTVVLAGNNTYTGTTTVSAGHLLVNGVNGTSPITVNSSSTLGGTGSSAGTVNVLAGGNLTPGIPARGALTATIGTLTAGNTTIGGTVTMKIDRGAVPNSDKLVAPSVVVNAGSTLTVNNLGSTALAAGDTFTLFSTPISGAFSTVNLPTLPNSNLAWTNKLAIDGTIAVVSTGTVNPSPTTITVTTDGSNMTLSWPLDHTGWTLQVQTNSLATGVNNNWFDVPGSTATNAVTVPLVPANPTVFYRLKL